MNLRGDGKNKWPSQLKLQMKEYSLESSIGQRNQPFSKKFNTKSSKGTLHQERWRWATIRNHMTGTYVIDILPYQKYTIHL